jgi:HEAT repeat protein
MSFFIYPLSGVSEETVFIDTELRLPSKNIIVNHRDVPGQGKRLKLSEREGMEKTDQKLEASSAKQASDEIHTLYAHLLLAGKNVFLYPDGHGNSLSAVRRFHEKLASFLQRHGEFKIDIEKDRVTCRGEELATGPFEEGTPIFTLFRDGIQWIEFSLGVTEEEIRDLFALMKRYKLLPLESDGDFVTALWEKRFPHIQYEAADIFFGDQTADMSSYVNPESPADMTEGDVLTESLDDPIDPAWLVLTDGERETLQTMILAEETADHTSHLFVLLDSLLLYDDEESFRVVSDVLAEEFKAYFTGRNFQACLIILEGVRHILESGRLDVFPWANHRLEDFLIAISDGAHLKTLLDFWPGIQTRPDEILVRILHRLHPRAAIHVAPLLWMSKTSSLQRVVEGVLIDYGGRDTKCLEPLVRSADEKAAIRLIPILAGIRTEEAGTYLRQLMHHPSALVRRPAIRTAAQSRKLSAAELFEFIDDPDETVRRLVLSQWGLEKDPLAETLLTRYLQQTRFTKGQTVHILECFKALGQCGSQAAIPFLRKTLLGRKWTSTVLKSPFRRGALLALIELSLPAADQVIEEARRSKHPGLRRIVSELCGEKPTPLRGEK